MSANVQHILLNLEAAPPAGVWDTISARLDAEFNTQEIKIAEKLYDWEAPPPPGTWENIALAIRVNESRETQETPAKVIRLPFRRLAVAAAVLGIVGFATWNFLNRASGDPIADNRLPTVPSNTITDNVEPGVQPSLPVVDASIGGHRRTAINIARRVNATALMRNDYISNALAEENTTDIPYAEVDGMRAQVTTSRKGIKAPLIKDANGNIIMDNSLIISRDNNYIIITCPNGEQTRLSTKFLPLLLDLNATMDPAEYFDTMMRESSIWKNRFSQWRYKLMQQASFAPTATNFLDIMALKELIEEKQ
ncbi:hypothetical protein D3H65_14730 [Paraflavitalea soli]|uniref:Uncharacterized protein n=1 Tax=Paraflavitalea soli TaxID=2315862 RepID=A0A3B7MQ99_9BACT|nr:hypothetical protein [Paraflavitalea soli]AXY75156.1 hypothetical protein D3H65_14730 [Paraflavitalea soli]